MMPIDWITFSWGQIPFKLVIMVPHIHIKKVQRHFLGDEPKKRGSIPKYIESSTDMDYGEYFF